MVWAEEFFELDLPAYFAMVFCFSHRACSFLFLEKLNLDSGFFLRILHGCTLLYYNYCEMFISIVSVSVPCFNGL